MPTQMRIPVLDSVIILIYILVILAIGVFSSRQAKMTGQVFFLAGRSLPWGMVGAALFASNISTIHLVGLTASGYNEGLVWGNFEMDGLLHADTPLPGVCAFLLSQQDFDTARVSRETL